MHRLKLLLIFLLPLVAFGTERPIAVTLPAGWSEVPLSAREKQDNGPFLTLKFQHQPVPTGEVMITLIGDTGGKLTDLAGLRRMHQMQVQQWLSSPDEKYVIKDLAVKNGLAIYSVHEDASLIGKPLPPDEWRAATPVALLLDQHTLVHSTIFTNETSGEALDSALQLVASLHVTATGAANPPPMPKVGFLSISFPGIDQQLLLPSEGLRPMPSPFGDRPHYFLLVNDHGVNISGWLEPKSKRPDIKAAWKAELAKMAQDSGAEISDEKWSLVNGWQVLSYTVKMNTLLQQNIRATRTEGDTWFDVHLSSVDQKTGAHEMDNVLRRFSIALANSK